MGKLAKDMTDTFKLKKENNIEYEITYNKEQ